MRGIKELAAVEPSHIAAFIKQLGRQFTPPTVKQHLAALRIMFDWLVIGHIIDVNPAHAVRGPKYVVRKGKTSVLTAEEARELLDSIPLMRNAGRGRKVFNLQAYERGSSAQLGKCISRAIHHAGASEIPTWRSLP